MEASETKHTWSYVSEVNLRYRFQLINTNLKVHSPPLEMSFIDEGNIYFHGIHLGFTSLL